MTERSWRRYWVRSLAVPVALGLTACGGGDGETPAPPPPPPPPAAPSISGPLPDSINDATLEGSDEDADGIRDDVEVFIEGLELSADEDAFARGFAQAVQTMLLIDPESSSSASNAIAASDQTALAAICFRRQQGGNMSALTAIEAESLNNRARVEAFARVDSLLDGSVFNVPDPERLETICNGDEVRR